jgi:hypothetical protein
MSFGTPAIILVVQEDAKKVNATLRTGRDQAVFGINHAMLPSLNDIEEFNGHAE